MRGTRSIFLLGAAVILLATGRAQATPSSQPAPTGSFTVPYGSPVFNRPTTPNVRQNTGRAVYDWSRFNVGGNATLVLVHPPASALVAVNGAHPAQILGKVESHTPVILDTASRDVTHATPINTSGIVTATSVVQQDGKIILMEKGAVAQSNAPKH